MPNIYGQETEKEKENRKRKERLLRILKTKGKHYVVSEVIAYRNVGVIVLPKGCVGMWFQIKPVEKG